MKRVLAITVEEKVLELVEQKSAELGMNRSAFVEYVLRQYFGLYPKFGGDVNEKS